MSVDGTGIPAEAMVPQPYPYQTTEVKPATSVNDLIAQYMSWALNQGKAWIICSALFLLLWFKGETLIGAVVSPVTQAMSQMSDKIELMGTRIEKFEGRMEQMHSEATTQMQRNDDRSYEIHKEMLREMRTTNRIGAAP